MKWFLETKAHRLVGLGVLLMTTYWWLFPVMAKLAALAYSPLSGKSHHYYYGFEASHLIIGVYLLGASMTVIGGANAAQERYKREPKSFTRFNGQNLFRADFWFRRLLIVGILFLLAPVWCLPIVNQLAIKIAAEKVGYGSFLLFDSVCVGLQSDTLVTLFQIGFYVTLAGLVASAMRERLSIPKSESLPITQN